MEQPTVRIKTQRTKTRWYVNFADFANMVKAFIGSNYLYVAFAFSQCGLVLGVIGMLVISGLTDHCCHLIVKTKHHGINNLIKKRKKKSHNNTQSGQYNSYDSVPRDSGLEDDEDVDSENAAFLGRSAGATSDEESDFESVEHDDVKEHMATHMSYGDVGKLAFGGVGVAVVNFCIALTQFGFCVNYFIFIGNTIHSLFPVHLCWNASDTRVCKTIHDNDIKEGLSLVQPITSWSTKLTDMVSSTTVSSVVANVTNMTTILPNITTLAPNVTSLAPNITTLAPNITTLAPNITTFAPNITTLAPNITTISPNTTNVTIPWTDIQELVYTAPDLRILVVCPIIIFIIFALIRSVRYLGVISVLANLSILFGCVSVFFYLVLGFKVHDSILMFRYEGFPIFFGMVTGAFEGIGLVIPVESSMVGNRHLFSAFLHGAILFLTFILGFFGILGYLKFGHDVHQMINTNIPASNPISVAVNIGICIGILLTFPLQIFPVIEIVEKYLFTEGRIFGPSRSKVATSEEESLMPTNDTESEPLFDDYVGVHIPDSVPAWKRNIVRILIVIVAGGLAVLLRDNFAYVGAFVGAVGSSALAFILPCLFHLRLCWHDLNFFVRGKDIIIVVFGIFASIISVGSVIQRLTEQIDV